MVRMVVNKGGKGGISAAFAKRLSNGDSLRRQLRFLVRELVDQRYGDFAMLQYEEDDRELVVSEGLSRASRKALTGLGLGLGFARKDLVQPLFLDELLDAPTEYSEALARYDLRKPFLLPLRQKNRLVGGLLLGRIKASGRRHKVLEGPELDALGAEIDLALEQERLRCKSEDYAESLRTAMEGLGYGVLILREDRVVFENGVARTWLGGGEEDQELAEFFGKEKTRKLLAWLQMAREADCGKPDPLHLSFGRGKNRRHLELDATELLYAGAPACMILFRDVTEARRHEEELQWNQRRLQLLNKAQSLLSDFSALEENLGTLMEHVSDTLGIESLLLSTLDEDGYLCVRACRGSSRPLMSSRSSLSSGCLHEFLASNERLGRLDLEELPKAWRSSFQQAPHALALRTGTETQGVLVLSLSDEALEQDGLVELIESLAQLCSAAIARSSFYTRLGRSEERHRLLFQEVPVGLCLIGSDSLEANRNHLEIFGPIGSGVEDLGFVFQPSGTPARRRQVEAEKAFRSALEACRSEGRPFNLEEQRLYPLRGEAHEELRVHLTGLPVTLAGDKGQILLLSEDVTERVGLQSQVLHMQKLESLGRLASTISHEFGNFLQVILGGSALARLELDREGSHTAEHLERIERVAHRAADLTEKLRAYSRKAPRRMQPVPWDELLESARDLTRSWLDQGVVIDYEVQEGLPDFHCDAGQIQQVLLNLLLNARDAMGDGGKVLLRIEQRVDEGDLRLTIADSGSGIPEEILDRIFDPFFTTKEEGKGSGLGLGVVAGIVESHGGRVEVETTEGSGSRFHLHFPLEQESVLGRVRRDPGLPNQSPLPSSADRRILIVDDEEQVRSFLELALTSAGYRVESVGSGEEALELVERRPSFDLFVVDVVMPGMSGHELHDHLKELHPSTPILMCSGYDPEGLPMDRPFFPKPSSLETILGLVSELLQSSRDSQDSGLFLRLHPRSHPSQ